MTSAQGAAAVSMPIARYSAPAWSDTCTAHVHGKDIHCQHHCADELQPPRCLLRPLAGRRAGCVAQCLCTNRLRPSEYLLRPPSGKAAKHVTHTSTTMLTVGTSKDG